MLNFERLTTAMTRPWMIVFYLGLVIVSFVWLDQSVATFFYNHHTRVIFPILASLTFFGVNKIYLVGLFLLAMTFRYVYRRQDAERCCWFLWLSVLIPTIFTGVLKVMMGRARPELWFDKKLYGFYGFHLNDQFWSFPSGHTTTITGLMLGLVYLFPRWSILFLMAGLTIIATRVILFNHYLSDVLLTFYLVMIEMIGVVYFLRRSETFRGLV